MSTHKREICNSFRTLTQMMRDRGTPCPDWEQLSGDDVIAIQSGRTVFYVDDVTRGCRLVYDMSFRFRLPNVKKFLDAAGSGMSTFLLVVANPTPAAAKSVRELQDIQLEMFDVRSLQFNVSHHELVPRHDPIRDESEIEDILKLYSLKTRTQLPLIYSTDPMARYLALRPGQLVRITRRSPSAGVHVLYRCCAKVH